MRAADRTWVKMPGAVGRLKPQQAVMTEGSPQARHLLRDRAPFRGNPARLLMTKAGLEHNNWQYLGVGGVGVGGQGAVGGGAVDIWLGYRIPCF
jgi:hypothetical protein